MMANIDDDAVVTPRRTIAEDMDFKDLSTFLERLTNAKVPKQRLENLQKYFDHFRSSYRTNYKTLDPAKATQDSIFSIARIFLPTEDKKRRAYNLKGHSLARIFAKTLGLSKESEDGRRLLEYKNPNVSSSAAGDLGNVVFSVLQRRTLGFSSSIKSPSLAELHTILDQLAKNPENDVNLEVQRKILQGFIPKLSPIEGKWLTRILLKHLGLGLTTKQIFGCIHSKAQDYYSRTGNLEAVCIKLNDPNAQVDDSALELFQPFKPMLCARLNAMEAESKPKAKSSRVEPVTLPAPPFLIETKWDGERFQIHYDSSQPANNRFRYFSRNMFDFTSNFNQTLSSRLLSIVNPTCESFILDGEMMAWKKRTGTFTQKGANIDVKKMKPDNPNHCPAFVVYDIVFFNGESLIKKPLKTRISILVDKKLVLEPEEGTLYFSQQTIGQSKEQVIEALNAAVDDLQEGLVVKELQSVYEVGKRGNSWLKIKPEFFSEHSLDDLDLIILGGYYTESIRKTATISHFLVGLLDNNQPSKPKFYPVARVGSGRLRSPDMDKLLKDLEPHFVRGENPSFNIEFKGRKHPDFYIDPKKSIVVQVKATEILYHDSYALKYTLRFPRIVLVRRDKSWQDILTLKEFHEIRVTYGGKFAKRNDDVGSPIKKKPRSNDRIKDDTPPPTTSRSAVAPPAELDEETLNKIPMSSTPVRAATAGAKYFTVSKNYKSRSNTKSITPPSSKSGKSTGKIQQNIFESRVFCVIGSSAWKVNMEERIQLFGGEIVQNPTSDLFAIIAETLSVKVERFIQKNQYDVYKESWVNKCISSKIIEKLSPEDLFAAKAETREELEKDFDIFGDSYRQKTSLTESKQLLQKIMDITDDEEDYDSGLDETVEDININSQTSKSSALKRALAELDPKDAAKIAKYNFLCECKIAFRGELHPQDVLRYQQTIIFYGGQVAIDEAEPGVTHVIAWERDSPTKRRQLSAFVVKPKWLLDCVNRKRVLEELSYMTD